MDISLNPANNEYAKLVGGMDKRLKALENTTQQQQIDWFEINASAFVDGTVAVGYSTSITIYESFEALFTVGDKFRIADSLGAQNNYYIIRVSNEFASAGQSIVYLATDNVSNIIDNQGGYAIANIANPAGFEGGLTYKAEVTDQSFNVVGEGQIFMTMSGNTVLINFSNGTDCDSCTITTTGTETGLLVEIPLSNLTLGTSRTISLSIINSVRSLTWATGGGGVLTIERTDGSVYPASSANSIRATATLTIL